MDYGTHESKPLMPSPAELPHREDLLRDATALVERELFRIAGWSDPLLIGFRKSGCLSLFCGEDPALHFNSASELRRAFFQQQRLAVAHGQLVILQRKTACQQMRFVSQPLSADQTEELCQALAATIRDIQRALEQGAYESLGSVPSDARVVRRFLAQCPTLLPIRVAAQPHAR